MPFPWIWNPGFGFWDLGMGIGAGERIWQHMGLCPGLTLSIEHHEPGGGSRLWLLVVVVPSPANCFIFAATVASGVD